MARGDGRASTSGAEGKLEEGEQWRVVLATATVVWVTANGAQPAGMSPEIEAATREEERARTVTAEPNPSPSQTQVSPYNPIYGSFSLDQGGWFLTLNY